MQADARNAKTRTVARSLARLSILVSVLFGGMASALSAKEPAAGADKTNILFIICDDLSKLVVGPGAHPQAQTPNLDKLARRGVSFANAQANAPLCAPSRYSLVTGLYPHTLGVNEYIFIAWDKLPNSGRTATYMDFMKTHGYKVYGTGKIFHNHSDKKDAFDWADGSNHYGHRTNWGPWPWDGSREARSDWGWASVHPNLPATYTHDSAYAPLSDVPEFAVNPAKGVAGAKGWFIDLDGKLHVPFRYVSEEDRDPMPDEQNAEWATTLLGGTVQEPFIMSVGMNRPHTPMYAPKKYFDRFPLESITLPPVREGDLSDVPPSLLRDGPGRGWGFTKYDQVANRDNCNGDGINRWKEWIQGYLANVAFVDDQIGRILSALEASPYAANTLVILTSDNGYHMGQKEYLHKNTLWEESCNIPLIAAGPGVAQGKSCDQPVSLIDLYPTFLDYAAIAADPYASDAAFALEGSSLRPLLQDPERGAWAGPAVALSEITGKPHPGNPPFTEKMTPDDFHYSIRSKNFRYIRTKDGQEELYDHRNDPHEWTNLANHPGFKGELDEHRRQMERVRNSGKTN